jgi:hypothetical protein
LRISHHNILEQANKAEFTRVFGYISSTGLKMTRLQIARRSIKPDKSVAHGEN